jgi:hypothetical protein
MSPRAWTFLSAAGLLLFLAIVATQGMVANFDPSRQQVSEYVHSSAGALMTVGFLAWSLSLGALAGLTIAAARSGGDWGRLACLQSCALLLAAAGMGLLACFPTDRGIEVAGAVTNATFTGHIHDAASALSTASLLVAALAGASRRSGSTRALTLAIVVTGIACSVALLAIGDPVPGIRQRVLLVTGCLWQIAWLLLLRAETAPTSPGSSADSRCSTS